MPDIAQQPSRQSHRSLPQNSTRLTGMAYEVGHRNTPGIHVTKCLLQHLAISRSLGQIERMESLGDDMKKIIFTIFLALGLSGNAIAAPPSHAQACNGPALNHNPHCVSPISVPERSTLTRVSVPEPSTLTILGGALAALYLVRRRKRKI